MIHDYVHPGYSTTPDAMYGTALLEQARWSWREDWAAELLGSPLDELASITWANEYLGDTDPFTLGFFL